VNAPVLVARGLSRRWGAHVALAPLELELREGEALAVVGSNGAGKSTLLSLLAGGLEPSAGEVAWREGVRVGWVPQRPAHYARLTARENLELFARLEGAAGARAEAGRLLAALDLPDDGRPAGTLSVGNRQRLDVALALVGRPDALLLDEPTSSLDPARRRLRWETAAAVRARGGSVVFATQHPEEVEAFADRALLLRGGEVAFAGPAAGLGEEWP
jgi:ABC-2 type transport system ATP-binding protein